MASFVLRHSVLDRFLPLPTAAHTHIRRRRVVSELHRLFRRVVRRPVEVADPPHRPIGIGKHRARQQRKVLSGVPLHRQLRVLIGQRSLERDFVPFADRTAAVMRGGPVVHAGPPLVAFAALPPHHGRRGFAHIGRKQLAVSLVVPLLGDLGEGHVESSNRGVRAAAVRTQACYSLHAYTRTLRGSERVNALANLSLPDVARVLVALPPHCSVTDIRDLRGKKAPVLCRVPLRCYLGIAGCKGVCD